MSNNLTPTDPGAPIRKWAYGVLIAVTAGITAGRILSVERLYEPSLFRAPDKPNDPGGNWPTLRPLPLPSHGDNDRSRWVTIRTLVEQGTYSIGRRLEYPPLGDVKDPSTREVEIDEAHSVVNAATVGRILLHLQPLGTLGPTPFLPPVYADVGATTEDGWRTIDKVLDPETKQFYSSKPPLLPTVLAGEYWLLRRAFGWSITEQPWEVVRTILMTINWLPFVIYLVLLARLVERWGNRNWGRLFVVTAACLGTLLNPFLVTLNNHTVAACGAMFALYPFLTIWYDGRTSAWRFALAGLFAAWTACNELPAASLLAMMGGVLLLRFPLKTIFCFVPAALIPIAAFEGTIYLSTGQWTPVYEKFGTIWYEFPGSFWANPRGIDAAADPLQVYAFHLAIGHHGVISLTPIFLFSLLGMLFFWVGERPDGKKYAVFQLMALLVTAVVFAFYLLRTNNYGGWTAGARWFFWMIPLWLLAMQPIVDAMSSYRFWRGFGYLLLAWSALSSAYPLNPWRHPWLYRLLEYHY